MLGLRERRTDGRPTATAKRGLLGSVPLSRARAASALPRGSGQSDGAAAPPASRRRPCSDNRGHAGARQHGGHRKGNEKRACDGRSGGFRTTSGTTGPGLGKINSTPTHRRTGDIWAARRGRASHPHQTTSGKRRGTGKDGCFETRRAGIHPAKTPTSSNVGAGGWSPDERHRRAHGAVAQRPGETHATRSTIPKTDQGVSGREALLHPAVARSPDMRRPTQSRLGPAPGLPLPGFGVDRPAPERALVRGKPAAWLAYRPHGPASHGDAPVR